MTFVAPASGPHAGERPTRRFAGDWFVAIGAPGPGPSTGRLAVVDSPSTTHAGPTLRVHASSPADLPQIARREGRTVVFEGRLHDRAELRARLETPGASAASDAELVLAAYERWRSDLPSQLRGIYSIVVWDEAEERLLAFRDRMGHWPLFWSRAGDELVLATSPTLVTLHPEVSRELHLAVMAEILCFRFLDARETCFLHVLRVPPGHRLDRRGGGEPTVARYWVARFGETYPSPEVPERFAEVFERAVGRCLEAGRPALFLSGGLDSANVALTAADLQSAAGGEAPLALSLAFPQEVDEVAIQTGVATRLGFEQVLMPFWEASGGERTLLRTAELSGDWPVPLINLWRPAYLALGAEGVRRGREAILTGHGGDEWLDTGIDYAAYLIRYGRPGELYRLWQMARRSYPTTARVMARNLFWRYGARQVLVNAVRSYLGPLARRIERDRRRRFIDVSTPEFVAPEPKLRRAIDQRATEMLPFDRWGSSYLRDVPRYFGSPLVVLLHEDNFEASRRIGIPMLMPFLDPDVVEFACHVQPEDLFRGGRNKGLLRGRATPRLPGLGFDRQKKLPATSFMQRIVREQTELAWNELGGVPRLAELGLVDPLKLKQTLGELVSGARSRAYNLSVFTFGLECWARNR